MRRRSKADGKFPTAQASKAAARKSRIAPNVVRRGSPPAAGKETNIARLTRERDEALQTSDGDSRGAQSISHATFDLPGVLQGNYVSAQDLAGANVAPDIVSAIR